MQALTYHIFWRWIGCCGTVLLLVLGVLPAVAQAQEPDQPRLRIVIRDAAAAPRSGIVITLDTGAELRTQVTNDAGDTGWLPVPTGVITVTAVQERDGTALSFPMTALDGTYMLLVHGDLVVPWAYDEASRSVLSLPLTMENEAFPELPMLPEYADGTGDSVDDPMQALLTQLDGDSVLPGAELPAPEPPAPVQWWLWFVLAAGVILLSGSLLIGVRRTRVPQLPSRKGGGQ